jgi:peptidoglycan/LPS O-acetylase OafA/YrhL
MEYKRLPNLTGIRFILASLVVTFHIHQFCQKRGFPFFDNLSILNKGSEAVNMFFSLSGFLIIRQLYIEKSTTGSINLKNFFVRRSLRILPLYYLILSFGLVYYRFILPHFGFNFDNNYNLIAGVFLSFTLFPNIFASYQPGGIIEILWSIGIEEQFYVLIAPLNLFLPIKYILRFLIFFTIIFFILYFSDYLPFLKKYSMLFFYFSFSGICSILALYNKIKLQKLGNLCIVIFVFYFSTSIFKDNLSDLFYHLFSMLLFGLTVCTLASKSLKILDNKLLNYLGKISYGIYMYHAIIMQILGFLFLKFRVPLIISSINSMIIFNISVFILTIIIAHLSYKHVESYFLNLKNNYIRSK